MTWALLPPPPGWLRDAARANLSSQRDSSAFLCCAVHSRKLMHDGDHIIYNNGMERMRWNETLRLLRRDAYRCCVEPIKIINNQRNKRQSKRWMLRAASGRRISGIHRISTGDKTPDLDANLTNKKCPLYRGGGGVHHTYNFRFCPKMRWTYMDSALPKKNLMNLMLPT